MSVDATDPTPNYRQLPEEVSAETYVNVVAQYRPHYKAETEAFYDEISRPITEEEYEAVVTNAREIGLERLTLDRSMLADRSGPFGLF